MILLRRLFSALLLCGIALAAAAEVPVPALKARVTDLAGVLTSAQRTALEERLAAFEAKKGSQIAVLIVPTTQPETIEQYGIRAVDAWKLGRKGVDDGALLLVAMKDRAVRIEVGYGLEGVLPDAIAKRIIDEEIVPRFRAGDYYGGIEAGVGRMIRVIEGEPLPPPRARSQPAGPAAAPAPPAPLTGPPPRGSRPRRGARPPGARPPTRAPPRARRSRAPPAGRAPRSRRRRSRRRRRTR